MMKIGGIGALAIIGSAVVAIVAVVMSWTDIIGYGFAAEGMDYGAGISWVVGMGLLAVGTMGLAWRYRGEFPSGVSKLGILLAVLGLIAFIILWVDETTINVIALTNEDASVYLSWRAGEFVEVNSLIDSIGIAGIMWFVLNGVFLIWLGSSLKKISRSTTMPGVFSGTGILVVIAGILHLTILPFAYVVTQSLTILAMLPLTYLLLKAE
jgi:hypothetical protein